MHNFRELKIWQKSRMLVKEVYILTQGFPKAEQFGLTSQIRRSAVSIPSNIAEGCGRDTDKQLKYFLEIASGSSCELETQLLLAFDLEYLTEKELNTVEIKINEVQKMIVGFKKSLQNLV